LIASSVLIAVVSISATAWLAAQNTSGAIRARQGQVLARDTGINDALLGYAARHASWSGVAPTLRDLARSTGRRIALTTEARTPIADSDSGAALPGRASSVVDPLAVDVTLVPRAAKDRIDPRASGPFALARTDRARLAAAANHSAACLTSERGTRVRVLTGPSGRPYLDDTGARTASASKRPSVATPVPVPTPVPGSPMPVARGCGTDAWSAPTHGERAALDRLADLTNRCLNAYGYTGARAALAGPWSDLARGPGVRVVTSHLVQDDATPRTASSTAATPGDCLASARRQQLRGYTAPAALLFIADPAGGDGGLDLSGAGITRIGLIAVAIGVLTVTLSAVLATRLVRPVRALTDAAERMRDGDTTARVEAGGSGEVGRLAAAFNAMAAHLERMERQRKAMVSDVSHELRTPLSNVRGWLEAAEDGVVELDPKLTASLVEETLTLQRVVDDLQELALADAGKLRLHPEPVHVADLLDQIATAHRGRADAAGLRLTVTVHGDLDLTADPVRLRQALGNLVSNAIRYTPEGGAVGLRAYRDAARVVIDVTDTGVGIPDDVLPHVFDRFWRAEKSRSRTTGGSGLGLAIARNLVEAHGGTLTAASTPGEGSTFTAGLPSEG
jgi:two-component system sensor histidine kinase BaeS